MKLTYWHVLYPDRTYTRRLSFEEAKSLCNVYGGSLHREVVYVKTMSMVEQFIHECRIALRVLSRSLIP